MSAPSTEQHFRVEGMSCGHCENAVKDELAELSGVSNVRVSAEEGTLVLANDGSVSVSDIVAAVDEAGYRAELES